MALSPDPEKALMEFTPPRVRRSDVLDAAVLKARDDIMAQEDRQIFDALDSLLRNCRNEGHPGYGKPISDCEHPDCVAEHIHES